MQHRPKTRLAFLATSEGQEFQRQLKLMTSDTGYNTPATFSPNKELYPDNLMPFADKQINYIMAFPYINAGQYLANLKLRTRITK